jgi:hypothetical protein
MCSVMLVPVTGQQYDDSDYSDPVEQYDEFEESTAPAAPADVSNPMDTQTDVPAAVEEPAVSEYQATTSVTSTGTGDNPSSFQNAIIEGVQLTAEPGERPDEKIISGYFIFRDKPSSYFYEVKLREKKLVFEFNDTRVGSSPVPTASEPPIKGFIIEQGKIDVNKAVKGLMPEWHDLIRVVFDLEAVPEIHVNDEYSIITFSFKWTSDPEKQKNYIVKDQTPKVILWSSAGVGGVALGAVAYYFFRTDNKVKPLKNLSTDDLPIRELPE